MMVIAHLVPSPQACASDEDESCDADFTTEITREASMNQYFTRFIALKLLPLHPIHKTWHIKPDL